MNPPSGTITFLFTDIEGSTRLWETQPQAMAIALRRHDAILRDVLTGHGGFIFKTVGDAFYCAFPTPHQAVGAAVAGQRRLADELWPEATGALRVRMALHTGTADERDGDYFGPALSLVSRLLATGHGGQILLSGTSQELLRGGTPEGGSLRDLGQHHLKDIVQPEHIFQIVTPGLPDSFLPLKTAIPLPNNLPLDLSSFIGRDREAREIQGLLGKQKADGDPGSSHREARLVTLIGPAGTGKTRLSLHVASNLLPAFPEGVWLAELAAIHDPSLLLNTIASTLGIREEPNEPLTATVVRRLGNRHVLLLLDNCEHLIVACAELANLLLRHCPLVSILASSREALGTTGEVIYPVRPLSLPQPGAPLPLAALLRYDAIRLFVERAESNRSDFRLTTGNSADVIRVCRRLDGIPLAIELAAARTRILKVSQIAERLDDRFRLLTAGSRSALPHHKTLQATIDWSYDLLSAPERVLLRRLSVFKGGCRLEEAVEVCADEGQGGIDPLDVLDLLDHLVSKSLLNVDYSAPAGARYGMLETIGQYAHVKLVESNEERSFRDRHLNLYLRFVEKAASLLETADQAIWTDRLEDEYDNLRTALRWSLVADRGVSGATLASGLVQFWLTRGYLSEGRELLRSVIDSAPLDSALRAQMLENIAFLARYQGDFNGVRDATDASIAIWRALDNQQGVANSLSSVAYMTLYQGEYEAARALYEESLAVARKIGNPQSIADVTQHLGDIAFYQDDLVKARRLIEESYRIWKELGDKRGMAYALRNLAETALKAERYEEAWQYALECLVTNEELGYKEGIAGALEVFSSLFAAKHPRDGLRIAAASISLRAAVGAPDLPPHRQMVEDRLAPARQAVAMESGNQAVLDPLTVDEAIALVLDTAYKSL